MANDYTAAEIRAHLARRGLRNKALVAPLGVSEEGVGRRLRGVQPITVEELYKIAEFLDVEPASLLPAAVNQ